MILQLSQHPLQAFKSAISEVQDMRLIYNWLINTGIHAQINELPTDSALPLITLFNLTSQLKKFKLTLNVDSEIIDLLKFFLKTKCAIFDACWTMFAAKHVSIVLISDCTNNYSSKVKILVTTLCLLFTMQKTTWKNWYVIYFCLPI